MKRVAITAALAALALTPTLASASTATYPPAVQKHYLQHCERTQGTVLCRCTLRYLEAHVTFRQLAIDIRQPGQATLTRVATRAVIHCMF